MNLASLSQRRVISLDRAEPLERAARAMRDSHVGALVVTETTPQGRRVLGIVTDRDLALQALMENADAATAEIGDYVDGTVVAAPEDADLAEGIECMREAGVRRLVLHDDEGHLTGVVSFDDLLAATAAQLASLAGITQRGLQHEVEALAEDGHGEAPVVLRLPAMGTAGWTASASVTSAMASSSPACAPGLRAPL
jgi:CBS domain-containing protein